MSEPQRKEIHNQDLMQEYEYKSNISAYQNLTIKEKLIHQQAFFTGYKLGLEHHKKKKHYEPSAYKVKILPVGDSMHKNVDQDKASRIIQAVIDYYRIYPYEEVMSAKRYRELAIVRSIIINLLRDMLHVSQTNIGRLLGNRDHTTIIHHLRIKMYAKSFWDVKYDTMQVYQRIKDKLQTEFDSKLKE